MEWIQVDIFTATPAIDILTAQLPDLGIVGCQIQDAQDFQEFLEDKEGNWDELDEDLMGLSQCETTVTVYLPDNDQGREMMAALQDLLQQMKAADTEGQYGRLETATRGIREEDWANTWKQYFKPFPVGEKLYIKPSWEPVTEAAAGRTILEIDPASSFGTGQHHTTRLCLEFLEKEITPQTHLLDLGCGSGILLIAGMLLGAEKGYGTDISENAVRIARENAEKNHLDANRYTFSMGNIVNDEALRAQIGSGYDLIVANIVADVLIAMAPLFHFFLKPNGKVIVSGIITERADEVLTALQENGYQILTQKEASGWVAAVAQMPQTTCE